MRAEITSSAKREEELSKSDYISLSWNSTEKVVLPVGAYINHTYKIDKVREVTRRFLLLEEYEPTQTDEMSWKYTPEFQHPKMVLSKVPFYIRTRNSQNEEVKQHIWSFVGTMATIADKLKDFLNHEIAIGNAGWTVHYDETNSNTINVSFNDNDFISALSAIANAIGDNCEWHIDYDNEVIHLGKVSDDNGDVVLKVGENVGVPSISNSKESYYNSFAVFGGSRNITQLNNKGENISSSDIRLQLSKGSGTFNVDGKDVAYTIDEFSTIDIRNSKSEPQFTKVLDFSHIFPSLNTYVYNVRGREKYVLDNDTKEKIPLTYNTDGSVATYKTFTVWYMRLAYPTTEKVADKELINTTIDDGVTHYWYDFEITDNLLINGKNIGCSFEANFNKDALSTPLAGRGSNGNYVGFELTYHKEASSSHSSDDVSGNDFSVLAGDYEIVYQEDNGLIIPTNAVEMIVPKGEALPSLKCNITVLYNIVMADSIYIKDAQQRLFDAAIKEIQRLRSDLNNYTIKSYPQVFVEQNPYLQIGQKVTYDDGNGYTLSTRVLKLSTNIDYNFIQEITVGNQAIKGTITQLKDDVQSIIASGENGSGGSSYTEAQLRNLIARYGTSYFLSKQFDDTAQGLITFVKGLISDMLAKLKGGATFGTRGYKFDEKGNVVVDAISSLAFDEALERGFGLTHNSQGKYTLSVTDLMVWGKAVFNSLEIRKLYAVGGNVYLSGASSKLQHVVPVADADGEVTGWKCYILGDDGTTATQNGWRKYDQAKCQTFDIEAGTHEGVSNTFYWRLVVDVSTKNETITETRTETYVDDDGVTKTREVTVDLYDGKKFGWVILSKTDCESATNDAPKAGDTIVLDGHRMFASGDAEGRDQYNDESRTNVMMLETTGTEDGTLPRIVALTGIVDYRHWDGVNHYSNTVFTLSPKEVVFVSSCFKFIGASGDPITLVNFRGNWAKDTEYRYYDQVSHNDSIWTCIVEKGKKTTEEPSDTSTYWRKEISGGKDGKDGKSARRTAVVNLTSDKGTVFNGSYNNVLLRCSVEIDGKSMGGRIPGDNFTWTRDGSGQLSDGVGRFCFTSSSHALDLWKCSVKIPKRLLEPIELTALRADGNSLIFHASEDISKMTLYPCWKRYYKLYRLGGINRNAWGFHDMVHDGEHHDSTPLPFTSLGDNNYSVDMSQLLSFVESHNIVLHKTAKVTTEKTALRHGKHTYWLKQGADGKYHAWGRYGVWLADSNYTPVSTVAKCKIYVETDSDTSTTGTASLSV